VAKLDLSKRYEDPTIAEVAAIEANRLWAEIERGLVNGGAFHHTREAVLAKNAKRISKAYGNQVWSRIVRGIESRSPTSVGQQVEDAQTDYLRRCAIERHGRLRLRDRISFKLFGLPWSY